MDAPYLHWQSEAKHQLVPHHAKLHEWFRALKQGTHTSFYEHHPNCFAHKVSEIVVADCHYRGQSHTLPIEVTASLFQKSDLQKGLCLAFH